MSMMPAMERPSFSRITYSLLRWACWINAPRLLRALAMGIVVIIGEDV
jgi:hypothetical protein